jgi:hypothetical protein
MDEKQRNECKNECKKEEKKCVKKCIEKTYLPKTKKLEKERENLGALPPARSSPINTAPHQQMEGNKVNAKKNNQSPTQGDIKAALSSPPFQTWWEKAVLYYEKAFGKTVVSAGKIHDARYRKKYNSMKLARIYQPNLVDQMCMCRDSVIEYRNENCTNLKKSDPKERIQECSKFYRRLTDQKPENVCPLLSDPLGCGIPAHLDLYGKRGINVIEYNIGRLVNDVLDSKKIDVTKDCKVIPNVTFTDDLALRSGERKDWSRTKVRQWVKSASKATKILKQNGIPLLRWTKIIAGDVGSYFRKHCTTKFFEVRFKLKCRSVKEKIDVGGLDFKGMGYTIVPPKGRRRRLLQMHLGGC